MILSFCVPVFAQSNSGRNDTNMVFGALKPPTSQPENTRLYNHTIGVNLLISTNGFGLGGFYRHAYSDELAGFLDLSISEAKDDNEVTYFDPYTGLSYTPGKINRFLLFPLMVGVQERLFKDDIMDNFRPYIEGAIGPTAILVFPYNMEYFSALGHGHFQYTGAAFIGLGAYFGGERSNVMGIAMRYYFIPYPNGILSFDNGVQTTNKSQFGGFYITMIFGNSW
ncbi:MAG: hypothetical protein ACHQQQ_02115 [Bacteroidota bacterium]